EATYLAKLCRKVYTLVRPDEFGDSKPMVHRVMNTSNMEVLYNTEAKEIVVDESGVTGVRVVHNLTHETLHLNVTGFFVAIGHKPNTELFEGVLDMDETGYLITKPDSTATNIPGVFGSGDVQDHVYRQAITVAGTGCLAALEAERYLTEKENPLE